MITLKTFVGAENTAEDDSTLYKKVIENGIIEGCNFTKSGDNQINISDGYIMLNGRNIQVVAEQHLATLSTSGTKQGALYLNLDIQNTSKPIELISEIGKTTFTENQLLLATYTATALSISNLTVVCDRILDARKNKIQVVKKFPPFQAHDITKGYLIGDSWTVPNIIFHNLIKNGDDVKVADWIVDSNASLEKWHRGFKLTVNEPMGNSAGAIQNTNIYVDAGHTYFAKFNRKTLGDGEYLELIITAGNVEIFKKTVENTSDPNAIVEVFGTFVAPQNASGKLSYEFRFGNYVIGKDTPPIEGSTYIDEITLIDLTKDMTDLYKFNQDECSFYFFNRTFKTHLYKGSGTYVCLNNAEDNASWESSSQIADYVVERGTTDGWTWEKWASGKAVATGRFQELGVLDSTGITDVWVRYADFYFPTGLFVSAPFCFCDYAIWSYTEWCTCTSNKTDYTQVRRYSVEGGKDLPIDVVIKAEGTWK